jgi:hypothetical protein
MNCPKCGSAIAQGAVSCPACGAKLGERYLGPKRTIPKTATSFRITLKAGYTPAERVSRSGPAAPVFRNQDGTRYCTDPAHPLSIIETPMNAKVETLAPEKALIGWSGTWGCPRSGARGRRALESTGRGTVAYRKVLISN